MGSHGVVIEGATESEKNWGGGEARAGNLSPEVTSLVHGILRADRPINYG